MFQHNFSLVDNVCKTQDILWVKYYMLLFNRLADECPTDRIGLFKFKTENRNESLRLYLLSDSGFFFSVSTLHSSLFSEMTETKVYSSRIAFGSCNRQNTPQDFWKTIGSHNVTHFLWMGDAVYTKDYQTASLQPAYDTLLNNKFYRDFIADKVIDGVWDDHDFGVNDGSKTAIDKTKRQEQYVRFLKGSGNAEAANLLSKQVGLYHDLDISMQGLKIKVIFLDTRYFRDDNVIPSLGVYRFPFSALFSSALRGAYSVLGYFRGYEGEMLGFEQWQWLESTLQNSTAEMHLLISGVQIVTSNPVFESWGHFPNEQRKLLDMLKKYDPQGLVLMSGDVHLGELSVVHFNRENGERDAWVEVTSSGLTHSCGSSRIQKYLCPLMLKLFHSHRFSSSGSSFTGKNFGLLEISTQEGEVTKRATFSIMSMESNTPQLGWTMELPVFPHAPISTIDYPQFMELSISLQIAVYLFLLSLLSLFLNLILIRLGFSAKKKKAE
jgi:alkaline phosphatase D